MFWLGIVWGATLVLGVALELPASAPGFIYTNDNILPFLALGLLVWLCPASWLAVFACGLRRPRYAAVAP
jgi:hypothetical protein